MDYHSMTLPELKEQAKNHVPKIKHYYIKTRLELIKLLTMDTLPDSFRIEKLTIQQLRDEARNKGLPNIWKLRRNELIDLLYPSPQKDDKDNYGGKKHDTPEEGEGEKVRV
jgi:hypothetical protein